MDRRWYCTVCNWTDVEDDWHSWTACPVCGQDIEVEDDLLAELEAFNA